MAVIVIKNSTSATIIRVPGEAAVGVDGGDGGGRARRRRGAAVGVDGGDGGGRARRRRGAQKPGIGFNDEDH